MNISYRCSASAGAGLFALLLSATSYAQPAERTDSYDRIADEATAAALKLTDEQKTSVATVISERDAALAAAENDEAKAGVTADAQEKLAAVLSEEQQTQFSALFDTPRIKFNFRFQKWAEVLPWVAGEAGLSLVMETAPEGSFNYIDRREYKPDEAIDLLNGWLMIKGFTLIRRDQLLMCISLKDGIPDGTVPRVSLDELPNRGRFEFVSVLIPLEARDAAVVMAEIEPLVSAWGEANPLPATKQLLVTDAADIVRSIQQVALAVPPPKAAPKPPAPAPAPKPVLTTYPVQHANPAAVVELLKKFMSGTILLDETASQITINAVPAQHALAVKLMKQLEENQGPNRRPDLKTYPVDTDSPDQMITSLKLAVPTATLRYDSVARRLVVFATQADHDKLVATLRELENQATVSEDQLSVHPLKDIDPEVIQQLITSVLPDVRVTIDSRTSTLIAVGRLAELRAVKTLVDQLQPKVANISAPVLHSYPVPPEVSEIANTVISSVVPNATVTPDAANRRLLIVAQPKDHETIAATLDKLAQDVAANGLTLKSYDARGISYSSVSPLLQALVPDANLIDESANQRLLAIADAEDHEKISNVLEQIREDPDANRLQLRFYPLPDEMNQQQVTTLMSSFGVEASITVDDTNNRLMVTASADDHQKFTELLEQLTPEMPAEKPQLKSYSLPEQVDNETFTSMLTSVAKNATVRMDAVNKRLLITATAEDHAAVEQLLEQLTSGLPDSEKQLRFYPLPDEFNEQQVTTLMSSFGVEASITVDDTNNRLMVTASADDHQKFTELLEQLTPEMPAEKPQLKSYSLPEQVDNETFTSMLTSVAKNAMVRMDAVNKRLLITATAEDHAAVEQLLEQLTSGLPDSEKQLRFYPLPDEMNQQQVTTLMSSFGLEASITVDDTNNRLMVTASADDHQKFTELLEQLTPEMPAEKPQLKSYSLPEQVDNETFTSMLTSVAKNATVRMDAVNKRLLITATAEDHAAVEQLLEQLTSGLPDSEKQLRFYPLPDEFNQQQVTTLMSSFGVEASITVDDTNNRLMVTASADDHQKFTELLEQLTPEMPAEKPQLKSYSLPEQVDNETFTSMLTSVAKNAMVRMDAVNKRLLITATADDHAAVAQLLEQLTSDLPDANKRLQAYPLPQQISSETVSSMLLALAPGATVTVDSTNEHLLVTATDELQQTVAAALDQLTTGLSPKRPKLKTFLLPANVTADTIMALLTPIAPKATVTVDPAGKRILVTATDEDLALIGPMLMQLVDGQDQNQRELRSYPLKADVDPATVTTLLNSLTPEAAVTADPAGHRLLVTATSRDHASIDSAIAQITRDARGELPQLQYYPLGRVNGEYAVGILSSIVSGVTIKHEPESKRLSVIASESDHRILQETLVKLESAAPEREARTLRVYGVTKSQQARFSTVLQGLTEEMPELQVLTGGEPDEMIIWAKPSQHTIVDTVLAQLDRDIPADQKPSLVVYPISKVEAESVAEVLREIFPDATINVDSRASRLLVRARPAMQKTIKSAIRQLDEEIPDGREIKLMVYPVKGLNVEIILSLINQEVPQVTVIRDDTAETFIIRGQLEDHQKVAELLETLRASEVGKRIPAVYPLSQGDPNRVREFFERAFPGAMAVVDPDARTLTILATTEDQEQIRKFIEDLRRADAEHPHTSELKVYSVRGASSTELRLIISESVPRARLVIANDQLMAWAQADDQAVIQGIVDGLRDASGKLTVTAFDVSRIDVDTATSVLSTVAPGTQFMIGRNGRALIATVDENTKANVEAALAQLEKSPAARQEQTLRFYTVDRSTAPSVQNVLNAAVPEVSLLLSSDGTQLFARVTSDQHAKIAETLAQIAEANPFESIRVLRMYSIAKSGTNTSTVLQRMVPSAVVNVGSQPAQLMIEATESDHAQIEQLISQLEHAAGDSDRELKFYDVDPATIGNIRTTLTSVVPEVTLTTSTDNTRLIAHVTSAQHERIMETLQQLDVEQPFSSNRTLKVYSTTDSGANTSSVLQRMVPAAVVNSGGKPDQLLVEATERDHQRIVQLITQLEEASDDTERQLQFYNVDPATLSNTQTTLRSVVPEVTLTPSTDNTRLIAHVTGEQHERIVQTLEQLASEQPFNSNRLLKVYSIDRSGANTASVLQRMVPSAVVNAGSQPNQLLVEATEHDHQRIVQVITQLEEASGDTERQLKFYDVNPATVSSTQSALTSIVPEVTFTVSTDSTRLIAHVTDEQHEKIAQTLEQLSAEQPFRSNRVLKFYSVAKAGSDASSVLQRLIPSAVITSGTQSGQLMVEATPAQHEEIARLLTQITAAAAHDSLKVRFYAVDQRNLENIRSVVTAAVPDVSFRASADGTQLIAVVSDDQHAKIIEAVQALAQEQPFQSNHMLKFYSSAGAGIDALTVLQRMVPSALINNGAQADQLMVEATAAQHGELAELLASLKEAAQDDARSLKFYEVNRAQLSNAQELVTDAVPGLNIKVSADGTRLIALATAEQHEKIDATLEQLATAGAPRKTTSVFDITGTDPDAMRTALEPFTAGDDHVRITVDATSRRVYVHAFEDRQVDIREAITQIMAGVEEGADTQVATYFVGDGNGDEAEEALSAMYPAATIVSDRSRRLIIATATPEQHETIKVVAEQMQNAVSLRNDVIPRTYDTTHLDASYLESVLENLFPRDRDFIVSVNSETGQVVALAKETQHETIKALLLEIDREPATTAKTVRVYRTAPMTPTTVIATLEPLVSRHTTISAERSGEEIVVSAPAAEQTKIADLLQQMGISPEDVEKNLALYRVAPLDPRTVVSALEPLVSKHVTLSAERSGQEIVVSAPPEEQEKIATLVQQMRSHRTQLEGVQIRSYRVGRGQARDAISVLSPMFPDATLVTDRRLETVVATARPEEHETIAEVVKQMTGRGDEANLPTPKSYLLRQYDGNKMIEMLEATFTAADDVRVTWDDRNKRIIAIARPNQHEIISGIIRELDPHDGPYTRHLRFYHLPNLDLGNVNRVISGAIRNLDPGGSVAVDQNGETLMVTTHDRGHLLVKDALTRFRPSQPKRLRIYQLSFMDPWEARGAIDRMIIGRIPQHHLRPDVHPDDNLQQLWVRGTDNQLKEIEQLLVQLGEVGLTSGGGAGTDANLRVVPIGNDVEGAVRRIQDLWPRIRTNPIRVLEPNQESNEEQEPVPGQFSVPPEDVGELPTQRGPRMDAKKVNEQVRAADPNGLLGASIVPEPAVDDATGAASPEPIRFDGTDPVIVIPGNGRITIASDDTDALNQLESLLRTIYSQGSSGIENRDFSVRRLRNTAAADVAATIQHILDEAEGITYFGDVAVVPEERLNALIVYGNRTDRRRLDPLLEILDSEKLDSTRAYQTKLLPLKYASAARIEDVLQSIYRVQMTAGGRRSTMGIPSGVPSEVATVLRQINAAASAPLLIIETQRETNSLIIKAPPDLLNEVAELALELDEATFTRRANGMTLLPLKKSSSKRVMEILNNVLN